MTQLALEHLEWLEGRGIDAETAVRYGLHSGRRERVRVGNEDRTNVVPDGSGDVLVFPTVVGGKAVGEHYRLTRDKRFFQKRGSPQVFWNFECLLDPGIERGEPLVICEGQIDALTAISCGYPFAVSMPSGAQKPPEGRLATDLDPLDPEEADKPTGRFGSLYHARAQLKAARKIIIATDGDEPGVRLAAELVRRLGPGRCYRAEYPAGAKDLNDVLVRLGRDAAVKVLADARPYPTHGVYRLSDILEYAEPQTFSTGWGEFDAHFRLAEGMFVPVTGVPMHGKSLFVMNWMVRIALRHPVRIATASFETPVKPIMRRRLQRMALKYSWAASSPEDRAWVDGFLEDRFLFIEHDDREGPDVDVTIEWMLDKMHDAVMRYGIKIFVLDPWNEIEHRRDFREIQSEYQNRVIRKLKAFAKSYGVALIVVAHPTKGVHEGGKIRRPNLYDIDGSAAWRNKADGGLIVHRPDMDSNLSEVVVDKVKYEFMGKLGTVRFQFNTAFGRFEEVPSIAESAAA